MQMILSGLPADSARDAQRHGPSKRLVLRACSLLVYVEFIMLTGNLKAVHRLVRKQEVRPTTAQQVTDLRRAVDLACVFYFKRVLCLQRSVVTTLLLRQHGWNAEMVIGVRMVPFQSHAWVEIQGRIVNDKPYLLETYRALDRC
jgi:Transglutaminase-like superfamily